MKATKDVLQKIFWPRPFLSSLSCLAGISFQNHKKIQIFIGMTYEKIYKRKVAHYITMESGKYSL